MPQVAAASLGAPDATGGVYLPLVAAVSDSPQTLTAVYRLRLADGRRRNTNPTIADVIVDRRGRRHVGARRGGAHVVQSRGCSSAWA